MAFEDIQLTRSNARTALWLLRGLAPVSKQVSLRKFGAEDKDKITLVRGRLSTLAWLMRSGVWGVAIIGIITVALAAAVVGFWLLWPVVYPRAAAFYEWVDVAIPTVVAWFVSTVDDGLQEFLSLLRGMTRT